MLNPSILNRFRFLSAGVSSLPVLLGLILLTLSAGCPGLQTQQPPPVVNPATDSESPLRAGDQIQVRIEASTTQPPQVYELMVEDTGHITLPFIGHIKAAGLSTGTLADQIHDAYVPKYYVRCSVNVLVPTRFFYVGGEARAPGRYPWSKDVTLIKAINTAQGFTDFATRTAVELTRGKTKKNYNCEQIRQHPENDVAIQPGDSIYIPRGIF